ncbi:MAG TPA: aminopeptidase P family N-terminal domain-containing protein [Stellaceae bacterium]|jgi:Xaa-Pro aminopeptidase|nr:aminopeptidase P family N-terminal domain-containing protein [Stellaceae bacterium]
MRRGYIGWSKAELPEAVFAGRVKRLRDAMAQAGGGQGLDAMIVYTNNTRTAGVSWLTAFVPYWAEGLLVVPKSADPYLTMAFSNRIVGWGKNVSCVAKFEGGGRPGQAAGKYLAELGAKKVGVADLEGLRAAVAQDLTDAAAGAEITDATTIFERVRLQPDAAEIALAAKAGAIAQRALALATGEEKVLGDAVSVIDHHARLWGAEEVYMAAAPDLDRATHFIRPEGTIAPGKRFALRATVAYKGSWVRMTRCFGIAEAAQTEAHTKFAAAVAQLPRLDAFWAFPSWSIEGCRLAQPLDVFAAPSMTNPRPILPGALLTAQALIAVEGNRIPVAAPVLTGAEGFPASLLVAPIFS